MAVDDVTKRALAYASELLRNEIYRKELRRAECIANGQAVYAANLAAQLETLESFDRALNGPQRSL